MMTLKVVPSLLAQLLLRVQCSVIQTVLALLGGFE
jgi:hypothetical protein